MDAFLNPISTRKTSEKDQAIIKDSQNSAVAKPILPSVDSPESALGILTSQPSSASLFQGLRYLVSSISVKHEDGFNILLPSPKSAQIVFALVKDIVPNFWPLLCKLNAGEERRAVNRLIRCVRSKSGLGALLACLRAETDELNAGGKGKGERLEIYVGFFEEVLKGDGLLFGAWGDLEKCESKPERRQLLWKEFSALVASGRLVSGVAEADVLLRERDEKVRKGSWIAEGVIFAEWLGKNLKRLIEGIGESEWAAGGRKAARIATTKSLTFGYKGESRLY